MWKRLVHPNVVPLLGVTVTPFQSISAWMPGGELPEYIGMYPYADRLGFVGSHSAILRYIFTPSPGIRRCERSRLLALPCYNPRRS